ncbi:MAG TPA: TonB-dependent receptor [Pseudomonadales bacterium]|nr:TonB-dependent receptor [Pseudomonadales bacterium]
MLLLCGLSAAWGVTPPVASTLRCDDLDLPAQPLDAALLRLGQSAALSIVFRGDTTRGRTAPPLQGDYDCGEALDTLLTATGLEHALVAERTVVIRLAPAPPLVVETALPSGATRIERPEPPPVEEVRVYGRSVTGSRILRPGLDLDAHVDVIDRQEIELSGDQTLSDVIRQLPAVAGNATSTLVTNGGDGTASITLRGLPASNTLVLLNGRRLNSDALRGESVDLNTIPLAAVERIEILKDGASAIYGADAIAGVINIVTRHDFRGLWLSAYGGTSSRDDLRTEHMSLLWGHKSERMALSLGAEVYDQGRIQSRDRDISRTADDRARGGIDKRSSATAPARITLGNDALILAEGASGTASGDFRAATDEDRFDFRSETTALVPSERWSLFGEADVNLAPGLSAYTELLYTSTEARNTLAQTPLLTGFEVMPLPVAANAAFNPFGVRIDDVRRRIVELPNRTTVNETDTERVVLGLRWRRDGSGMDLHLAHHETDAVEEQTGLLSAPELALALGPEATCRSTPACVPLNLFGPAGSIDRAMLDWIATDISSRARSSLTTFALNAHGSLGALPSGNIEFAVGAEYRDESLDIVPDPAAIAQETVGGANFGGTDGNRRIGELYGELAIPLLHDRPFARELDLQLATRLSRYSDFGQTQNPRVALRWRPLEDLLLRSAWAEGFRAPTLRELNLTVQQSAAFLVDPCAQPWNVGTLPGCRVQSDPTLTQFLTLTGGNMDLKAEQARSFTLGFLWTPSWVAGDMDLSVDYFDIEQEDVVDASAQFVVNENAATGRFADRVLRDAMGNLTSVTATNLNVGRRDVSGLDITFKWQLPPTRYGVVELAVNAAHIRRFLDQLNPDAKPTDQAGTFVDAASEGNGSLPDWKANLGLSWAWGPWEARYGLYQVSSLDEVVPGLDRQRQIDGWQVHNLQVGYRWLTAVSDTRLALGVKNLTDEAPPFSAAAFNDSFDARTYDLIGRYLYARLSARL